MKKYSIFLYRKSWKKLQVQSSAVSLYLEQLITDKPWSGVSSVSNLPPSPLPLPMFFSPLSFPLQCLHL